MPVPPSQIQAARILFDRQSSAWSKSMVLLQSKLCANLRERAVAGGAFEKGSVLEHEIR